MRRTPLASLALACLAVPASRAVAAPVYVALGDSITFGETNLQYVQSLGDRGYVALVANALAAQDGGVRPAVVNLAIDGETAASFTSGTGRVPPVTGRTDPVLASENLNYDPNALVSQNAKFLATVAAAKAAGNTITTVSVTLGFNDLSTAVGQPAAAVAPILAAYQAEYGSILAEVRQQVPNATLDVLGYYNPFPADPGSPAAPVFNTYGMQLNAIIQGLAAQNGATFISTGPSFLGHEADDTYLAQMPAGTTSPAVGPYQGTLPIGNVHPNATGYGVIAADVEAAGVPEPTSVGLLAMAGVALAGGRRRRA